MMYHYYSTLSLLVHNTSLQVIPLIFHLCLSLFLSLFLSPSLSLSIAISVLLPIPNLLKAQWSQSTIFLLTHYLARVSLTSYSIICWIKVTRVSVKETKKLQNLFVIYFVRASRFSQPFSMRVPLLSLESTGNI